MNSETPTTIAVKLSKPGLAEPGTENDSTTTDVIGVHGPLVVVRRKKAMGRNANVPHYGETNADCK